MRSCRKSWLVYTRTRDETRMEALWCLCLRHNRGSEWFSPPGRLREAQPAGCCLLGVFDGKSCEQTHRLCSFSSVNLLRLFTNRSLIYITEDQALLKDDQTCLNGKSYLSTRRQREKQGGEVMKQDRNWQEGQWRCVPVFVHFLFGIQTKKTKVLAKENTHLALCEHHFNIKQVVRKVLLIHAYTAIVCSLWKMHLICMQSVKN